MKENSSEEILEFINRRWKKDSDWCNGNCLWFALILKKRFPFLLDIYYLPVIGHFICGDGDFYYDATGIILKENIEEEPILFDELKEKDHLWYSSLINDCFM